MDLYGFTLLSKKKKRHYHWRLDHKASERGKKITLDPALTALLGFPALLPNLILLFQQLGKHFFDLEKLNLFNWHTVAYTVHLLTDRQLGAMLFRGSAHFSAARPSIYTCLPTHWGITLLLKQCSNYFSIQDRNWLLSFPHFRDVWHWQRGSYYCTTTVGVMIIIVINLSLSLFPQDLAQDLKILQLLKHFVAVFVALEADILNNMLEEFPDVLDATKPGILRKLIIFL